MFKEKSREKLITHSRLIAFHEFMSNSERKGIMVLTMLSITHLCIKTIIFLISSDLSSKARIFLEVSGTVYFCVVSSDRASKSS